MSGATGWQESTHEIAGTQVRVRRAGEGSPMLILHRDIGTLDQLPFYQSLTDDFDVLLPEHPGYGNSERPEWMRNVRDLGVMYRALLSELAIPDAALIGLGFGGWIAAEMSTMSPAEPEGVILVGPMGIAPPDGYILDQALLSYVDYAKAGFHDPDAFHALYGDEISTDQLVEWDICREMNFRIAWKPYMYSFTLPHLLKSATAQTLVVWGDNDSVVPPVTADRFIDSLPNAQLQVVENCGHCVEMEKPEALTALVKRFLNA